MLQSTEYCTVSPPPRLVQSSAVRCRLRAADFMSEHEGLARARVQGPPETPESSTGPDLGGLRQCFNYAN